MTSSNGRPLFDTLVYFGLSRIAKRQKKIQHSPLSYQEKVLKRIKKNSKRTDISMDLGLDNVKTYKDFLQNIPPQEYSFYAPYIDEQLKKDRVMFDSKLDCIALTSGTSGTNSKLIPQNKAMLKMGKNFRIQLATKLVSGHRGSSFLQGKFLEHANAFEQFSENDVPSYYISGVWSRKRSDFLTNLTVPSIETLSMRDWDEKIGVLAKEVKHENIIGINGIPVYLKKLLKDLKDEYGVTHLAEVWPNLEYCMYGGSSITPHKQELEILVGKPMTYMGVYVATEAPLGYCLEASRLHEELYCLNFSHVLFSFSPIEGDAGHKSAGAISGRPLGVHEIEPGKTYALNIGLPNGMIHYALGDVIEIVSIFPFITFKIVGRDNVGLSVAYEKYAETDLQDIVKQLDTRFDFNMQHFFLYPDTDTKSHVPGYHLSIVSNDKTYANAMNHDMLKKTAHDFDDLLKKKSQHYRECRDREGLIGTPQIHFLDGKILENCFLKHNVRGQMKYRSFFPDKDSFTDYIGYRVEERSAYLSG